MKYMNMNFIINKGVFDWSDLGRKERKRKEIGRKKVYFHCLIGRKSWEEKRE